MDFVEAIVLAAIQGITEFLPISSSGHLLLPAVLLGWSDQGLAFDVALHVGSLLAVVTYFRHDLIQLATAWLGSLSGGPTTAESRLGWYLILGTLPACIFGLAFGDLIEVYSRNALVLGSTTILFGLALGLADWRGSRTRSLAGMTWLGALFIGASQCLALVPGTSRSGITMTAALMLGFDRESSARFSFLLSIPLIVAAGAFKAKDVAEAGLSEPWSIVLLAVAVSAISAYLCIKLFLDLIGRIGMLPFVIYRLFLGALLLGLYFA